MSPARSPTACTIRGRPRGDRDASSTPAIGLTDDEHGARGPGRRAGGEAVTMARNSARPGRTVDRCSSSVLAVAYGLVAADRHLEAGARPRPPGRHPDHPDRQGRTSTQRPAQRGREHHRPAGQRLGCLRGRGDHPGQQRRSSSQIPGKTRTDLVETVKRQAQLRFRLVAAGARRPRARPRRHRPRAARRAPACSAVVVAGTEATTPSRRPSGKNRPPRRDRQGRPQRAKATRAVAERSPSSAPRRSPRARRRAAVPTSDVTPGGLHRGQPARPRRPADLDGQPRPGVGGRLQRLHLPAAPDAGGRRPDEPLVTCDSDDGQYEVPALAGADRGHRAHAAPAPGIPQSQVQWVGQPRSFNSKGADDVQRRSRRRWPATEQDSSRSCSTAR